MDRSDSENIDYAADHRGEDRRDEPDGPPWKPTRAGPGFILILGLVCAVIVTLFMMFILRIF